jgi:hypothetical protein
MVKKAFELTIDGKTYQVQVLRPGTISVDGNVYSVEVSEDGVRINDEKVVASLSEEFAIVGGKLYETAWSTE